MAKAPPPPSKPSPAAKPATPAPAAAPSAPAAAPAKEFPATPEGMLEKRVHELKEQVNSLEAEVKTIQGQISNRDPALVKQIKAENARLRAKLDLLETAVFATYVDQSRPRSDDEGRQEYEILKAAAIDFCKRANVNPEIWKNIAF